MKKWLFLLSLPFWGHTVFGQPSPGWQFTHALDSLLFPKGRDLQSPGFAVCIVQDGKIVYERQTGLANVKKQIPITNATLFNIGSVAKQFTAACILLLEEQGKLNRADSIQKYIPELPDFGHTITLHHLLSHTSGLHDHLELLVLQNKNKRSTISAPSTMLSLLKQAPLLAFAPGTDYAYCNTGYMLLYLVVERVSGMSMRDFAAQNLFQPLGMKNSSFQYDEEAALSDGTASYDVHARKKKFKKHKPYYNVMGATGVHCSLRDLVLWDQNFYHNQLGKGGPHLIEQMETSYHLKNGASVHYGAGLFVRKYRGIPVVDHSGGWNSFLIQHRRFRQWGVSVIVASNNTTTSPFPICDKICDKILTFKPLVEDFHTSLAALKTPPAALEGIYVSDNNRIRYVRLTGDTLKIIIPSGSKQQALALSFDPGRSSDTTLFFMDERSDTIQFNLNAGHTARDFTWEGGDYFRSKRPYKKLEERVHSDPRSWAGRYRSEAYKRTIRIQYKRRTGQLQLRPVFFLRYKLKPLAEGVFTIPGEEIILRFSSNGLILGHYWLQNIPLRKLK